MKNRGHYKVEFELHGHAEWALYAVNGSLTYAVYCLDRCKQECPHLRWRIVHVTQRTLRAAEIEAARRKGKRK